MAEQPFLVSQPGLRSLHAGLQMQSGLLPPPITGQQQPPRYPGEERLLLRGGIAAPSASDFGLLQLPAAAGCQSGRPGRGDAGREYCCDTGDPGVARQMLQSLVPAQQLQQQQQPQQQQFQAAQQQSQQLGRASGSLPPAVMGSQQSLSLVSQADVPVQASPELEGVLSEAHTAYRTGDFTRALQLCQTVGSPLLSWSARRLLLLTAPPR